MLDTAMLKSYRERFSVIRTLERENLLPDSEKASHNIMNLGKNYFFTYLEKNYFVKDINRYEETSDDFKTGKNYFVNELTCLCLETGLTLNFEWEYDDELEISVSTERLSFRQLKDDRGEGIDEDDLDQIADDRDAVVIKGEEFWYEDDWAAIFRKDGKEQKVHIYEFENKNGSKFLTVEEWRDSEKYEYEIYTSRPVNPGDMTVISKGDR